MMDKREPYNPLLKSYPDSDKINAVSRGAETLFTRLIAASDDAGRYYGDPGMVLGKLFTKRMCAGEVSLLDVKKWIGELDREKLITVYEAGGKRILQIVNPRRALRSDTSAKILFPAPDDSYQNRHNSGSEGTASVTPTGVAPDGAPEKQSELTDTALLTADLDNPNGKEKKSVSIPYRFRLGIETPPGKVRLDEPRPNQDQDPELGASAPLSGSPDVGAVAGPSASPDETVRGAAELPPGFVAFWAAWPKHFRKQGRSKCLQHWRKHKLEPIAGQVVAAVNRCKRSPDWQKQDGQFIPLPMTWLNRTPWETEPGEMVAAEATTDRNSPGFERAEVTPELLKIAFGEDGGAE